MKVKQKAARIMATALVITTVVSNTVLTFGAATWRQEESGNWYHYNEQNLTTKGWYKDTTGKWYLFLEDGKMLANTWFQDSEQKWYYLSDTGAMLTDTWWKNEDGKWYYFGSSGSMLAETVTPDGYTLNPDGSWNLAVSRLMSTWYENAGNRYYFTDTGNMLMNAWYQNNDGKWYYFGRDGTMLADTITPDGYTLNQDGSWNQLIPQQKAVKTPSRVGGGGGGGSGGGSNKPSKPNIPEKPDTPELPDNPSPPNPPNPPDNSGGNEDDDISTPSNATYDYSIQYKDVDTNHILNEIVGKAEEGSTIQIEHLDIDGYEICSAQPEKMTLTSNGKTANIYYEVINVASPSEAKEIGWEVRFVDADTRQKLLSPTRSGTIKEGGTLYINYLSKIVDGSNIWNAIEEPPIEISVYGPGNQIYYVEYELSGSLPDDNDPNKEPKEKLKEWLLKAKECEEEITGENAANISDSRFYVTNQSTNDIRVRSVVSMLEEAGELTFYIIGKDFEPNGLSIPNAFVGVQYSNLLEDTVTFGGNTYYITRMAVEKAFDPETCLHRWEVKYEHEPSCLQKGTLQYLCEKCGETEDTYTAPLGHIDRNADSVCDRCNERAFDQQIGSEISTNITIKSGLKRTLTFVCIDADYQDGMLYISKESIPLTDFNGYGNLNYEESNVRWYFLRGFQNDFSITGNSLLGIAREDSLEKDFAILLTEEDVANYNSIIPKTSSYLVRKAGEDALLGINPDGSAVDVLNPDAEAYGVRPAIVLAKPDTGVPDRIHWNIGDIQAREIDGNIYMFECIDQNYSDRTENHREAALFLCTTVIPANTGSTYSYEEQLDGTYDYVFEPGPIVNFGRNNDYKYSNIRKWLDDSEDNFYNAENISIGVDYAYMGSTEELRYSMLNEDNLRPNYIGNQKLTGKLFIMSIDEALKYKEYLWRFGGSDTENPDTQYGAFSKAYWLRNPMGTSQEHVQTKQVYVVDLVNGNIHPQDIKPNIAGTDEELKVTGTVGVRPAFAMPQD